MTTAYDDATRAKIDAQCKGWSHALHWSFFQALLLRPEVLREVCKTCGGHGGVRDPSQDRGPAKYYAKCPDCIPDGGVFGGWRAHLVDRVLMLGVYQGRDIAYLKAIRPDLRVTGADKFSDGPCADWAPDQRGLSWEAAGFGPPPAWQVARNNLDALGGKDVELHTGSAEEFLAATDARWDFIYIDTSHDYETTLETIRLAVQRAPWVGGDDYVDSDRWGVKRAVTEAFSTNQVFGGYIWTAMSKDFRGA